MLWLREGKIYLHLCSSSYDYLFALGRDDIDEFIKGKQTTQYSVYSSIGTNFGQN